MHDGGAEYVAFGAAQHDAVVAALHDLEFAGIADAAVLDGRRDAQILPLAPIQELFEALPDTRGLILPSCGRISRNDMQPAVVAAVKSLLAKKAHLIAQFRRRRR